MVIDHWQNFDNVVINNSILDVFFYKCFCSLELFFDLKTSNFCSEFFFENSLYDMPVLGLFNYHKFFTVLSNFESDALIESEGERNILFFTIEIWQIAVYADCFLLK